MPRSTSYPDIRSQYPDLGDVPGGVEFYVVAGGKDYNIEPTDILELAGDQGLTMSFVASVTAGFDTYLMSTDWRAGAAGGSITLLDEDSFASNSATAAPSQQSTKAYVDAGLLTKAATVHTHTASAISDASANGRSLVTAADYAAMRTLLNVENGATGDQTAAEIVALLDAGVGEARQDWDSIKGLSSTGAGALYQTALIASLGLLDGQMLGPVSSGVFTVIAVEPDEAAPGTATQVAGAITLDFTTPTVETTTSASITAVTITNLPIYGTGRWIVNFGGSHSITGTATWKMPGGTTIAGTSGQTVHIMIYRYSSTVYHFMATSNLVAV